MVGYCQFPIVFPMIQSIWEIEKIKSPIVCPWIISPHWMCERANEFGRGFMWIKRNSKQYKVNKESFGKKHSKQFHARYSLIEKESQCKWILGADIFSLFFSLSICAQTHNINKINKSIRLEFFLKRYFMFESYRLCVYVGTSVHTKTTLAPHSSHHQNANNWLFLFGNIKPFKHLYGANVFSFLIHVVLHSNSSNRWWWRWWCRTKHLPAYHTFI